LHRPARSAAADTPAVADGGTDQETHFRLFDGFRIPGDTIVTQTESGTNVKTVPQIEQRATVMYGVDLSSI
jgi:hypothetical protein